MPSQYYELEQKQRKKVIWKYQDLVQRIFGTAKSQQDANTYINNSNFGVQMMLTRIFNEWNNEKLTSKLANTTIKVELIPIIKAWIKSAKDFEIREVLIFLKYLCRDDIDNTEDEVLSQTEDRSNASDTVRASNMNRRKSDLTISEVIERSVELRSRGSSRFSNVSPRRPINTSTPISMNESMKNNHNKKNTDSRMRRSKMKNNIIDIRATPNSFISSRMSTGWSVASDNNASSESESISSVADIRNNKVMFLSPIETPESQMSDNLNESTMNVEDGFSSVSPELHENSTTENIDVSKNHDDELKKEVQSSPLHKTENKSRRSRKNKNKSKQREDTARQLSMKTRDSHVLSTNTEINPSDEKTEKNEAVKFEGNRLPVANVGSLFRIHKKNGTPYPK